MTSPNATPIAHTSSLPDSSGSAPRVSSPLNPSSTPTGSTTPLALSSAQLFSPPLHGPSRVHSSSDPGGDSLGPSMTFASAFGEASSSSLPDDFGEGLKSTFRDRSRSPARGSGDHRMEPLPVQGSTSPKLDMLSSWYGDNHVPRPWQDLQKRKKTVPHEQTLALDETRKVCILISALRFSSTFIDLKGLTTSSLWLMGSFLLFPGSDTWVLFFRESLEPLRPRSEL